MGNDHSMMVIKFHYCLLSRGTKQNLLIKALVRKHGVCDEKKVLIKVALKLDYISKGWMSVHLENHQKSKNVVSDTCSPISGTADVQEGI